MARLPLEPIGQTFSSPASEAALAREALLGRRRAEVLAGWGPSYAQAVRDRGQLLARERVSLLLDPGTELLPIGTFVNFGRSFEGSRRSAAGAGLLTGFGRVHDRWVVVIANDNTVASGAWWPLSPEKIQRAQEVALRLRLPVVYLVESSGLFLPEQARSFPGVAGAGAIFRSNAQLAAAGVPQIAGVFGPCIAGGGYMPIISDRVVMTEQAYMVIAGAALIKGAKALHLTSLDIGGPEVHVHHSGCADLRVPDDRTCVAELRRQVSLLPSSAVPWYRGGAGVLEPRFPAADLGALFPEDHRASYDMRQVIARLVDGSLFHEVAPERGREIITGVGKVSGLWAAFIANEVTPTPHPDLRGAVRPGGILYREGIAKISSFARAAEEDGLPLIWLQDVAGFDIGAEAENQGLLGYGSSLIYTNSTLTTPVFTILLRRASGAGYYAECGRPYRPVLQLATPLTRLAVMEGRTAAIASCTRHLDDNFEIRSQDPEERARVERTMAEITERLERDMDPYQAAANLDVDEIIALPELRAWCAALLEMSWQATGYRRVRNPRISALHDLEVVMGPM